MNQLVGDHRLSRPAEVPVLDMVEVVLRVGPGSERK